MFGMCEARGQNRIFSQDYIDITTNFLGNTETLTKFSTSREPENPWH